MSTERNGSCVRLVDVHKSYGKEPFETKVLTGVDLSVRFGEIIALYGPSGCGKTTLLNLIGAIDRPTRGEVWLGDTNIARLDRRGLGEVRKKQLGFIFQDRNLVEYLTALENVELALRIMGLPGTEIRTRALEHLELVGMAQKADRFPQQLAGGEQQRVTIARALAKHPALVLADEPTGNLDEANALKIAELIHAVHAERGTTFVIVTHNPDIARIADNVYYLSQGRIAGQIQQSIPASSHQSLSGLA